MMHLTNNHGFLLLLLQVLSKGFSHGFTTLAHVNYGSRSGSIRSSYSNSVLKYRPQTRNYGSRSVVILSSYSNPVVKYRPQTRIYSEGRTVGDLESSTPKGSSSVISSTLSSVASTLSLVLIDVALRRWFKKASISFPSSLAGCGLLFSLLIFISTINNNWGDSVNNIFTPGSNLLSKWLAVFFVPSLVTLPLAQPLGSALELAKVSFVVIFGFVFTLLATSLSVLGVRRIAGTSTEIEPVEKEPTRPVAKKPNFSSFTLTALSACTAALSMLCALSKNRPSVHKIATTFLMLSSTLASFVFGARLPSNFTKVVHPLVTCTASTWLAASIVARATSTTFLDQLRLYKTGSLTSLATTGAGDILLFMLGPSVVALACQMYGRKSIMKQNVKEVAAAVAVGSTIGGLFGTAFLVRLLKLTSETVALSLLPRNITSPLAMAIATLLGGADVSLAVSMVVITGLIGANFGASILDRAGIQDPVARGLSIGASAHGVGTAAFANEPDAFPFAAVSMALTASMSTILVTIPVVRKALIKIAIGV